MSKLFTIMYDNLLSLSLSPTSLSLSFSLSHSLSLSLSLWSSLCWCNVRACHFSAGFTITQWAFLLVWFPSLSIRTFGYIILVLRSTCPYHEHNFRDRIDLIVVQFTFPPMFSILALSVFYGLSLMIPPYDYHVHGV